MLVEPKSSLSCVRETPTGSFPSRLISSKASHFVYLWQLLVLSAETCPCPAHLIFLYRLVVIKKPDVQPAFLPIRLLLGRIGQTFCSQNASFFSSLLFQTKCYTQIKRGKIIGLYILTFKFLNPLFEMDNILKWMVANIHLLLKLSDINFPFLAWTHMKINLCCILIIRLSFLELRENGEKSLVHYVTQIWHIEWYLSNTPTNTHI